MRFSTVVFHMPVSTISASRTITATSHPRVVAATRLLSRRRAIRIASPVSIVRPASVPMTAEKIR